MSRSENWVEFSEIRKKISLEAVLERYGVLTTLLGSGIKRLGTCPIHNGTNRGQFSVNLEKNVWHCFGDCNQGGGVIEFVAMKEFGGKSPENIRKAALLLKRWYFADSKDYESDKPATIKYKKNDLKENKSEDERTKENPPLKFALKNLDADHPWFAQKGINQETAEYFGLGFCTKGMMAGRIAIPIRNEQKELVSYCGRAITEDQINNEGKYKFPPNFRKSEVVYNLEQQKEKNADLLIVESFLSVWWLYQFGIKSVVALMGGALSESQKKLISSKMDCDGKVLVLMDPDATGDKGSEKAFYSLARKVHVKIANLRSCGAKKPHKMSLMELQLTIPERFFASENNMMAARCIAVGGDRKSI